MGCTLGRQPSHRTTRSGQIPARPSTVAHNGVGVCQPLRLHAQAVRMLHQGLCTGRAARRHHHRWHAHANLKGIQMDVSLVARKDTARFRRAVTVEWGFIG